MTRALKAGRIAGRNAFRTGRSTAAYLKQKGKNALSTISGRTSCTLFALADVVKKTTQATEAYIDRANCGAKKARRALGDASLKTFLKSPKGWECLMLMLEKMDEGKSGTKFNTVYLRSWEKQMCSLFGVIGKWAKKAPDL